MAESAWTDEKRCFGRAMKTAHFALFEVLGRPKAELVEAIGRLMARAPEGLAALGVKGFEDGEPEDPDAHEEDEWR